eukprot:3596699-Rhodomonas_salina.1
MSVPDHNPSLNHHRPKHYRLQTRFQTRGRHPTRDRTGAETEKHSKREDKDRQRQQERRGEKRQKKRRGGDLLSNSSVAGVDPDPGEERLPEALPVRKVLGELRDHVLAPHRRDLPGAGEEGLVAHDGGEELERHAVNGPRDLLALDLLHVRGRRRDDAPQPNA